MARSCCSFAAEHRKRLSIFVSAYQYPTLPAQSARNMPPARRESPSRRVCVSHPLLHHRRAMMPVTSERLVYLPSSCRPADQRIALSKALWAPCALRRRVTALLPPDVPCAQAAHTPEYRTDVPCSREAGIAVICPVVARSTLITSFDHGKAGHSLLPADGCQHSSSTTLP
jgi:hypothetical protein